MIPMSFGVAPYSITPSAPRTICSGDFNDAKAWKITTDYDAMHRLLRAFEDPDQDSTLATNNVAKKLNLSQGKNLQYVSFAVRVGRTDNTFLLHAFHKSGGLVISNA